MGWFPVGLSIMVTTFSAINYMSIPTEVFGHGLAVTISFFVFFIVAWPIAHYWMPYFNGMKLTSIYEFLEKAFDWRVRTLASALFILWRLFWMATALYASAKILAAMTGWKLEYLVLLCGGIATIYTFWGGIRAVIWTDVLQFCVLVGGLMLMLGIVYADNGPEMFRIAWQAGKISPFSPIDSSFFSFDPRIRMTLWSGLIGVTVTFLSRYGADQVVVQRYFTARDLKACQRGIWINAIASFLTLSLLVLLGIAIYARACSSEAFDPVTWQALSPVQKQGIAVKQMAALIKSLPNGLCGLVFAGLIAATMSSIDSGINSCTAAYITDFQERNGWRPVSHSTLTLLTGLLSTSLGLLLIPALGNSNSLFAIVNKLVNGLGSPLLCIMLLGMYGKRIVTPKGVFWGSIIGLFASLWISFGVKSLALQYYSAANLIVAFLACVICSNLSILNPNKKGD